METITLSLELVNKIIDELGPLARVDGWSKHEKIIEELEFAKETELKLNELRSRRIYDIPATFELRYSEIPYSTTNTIYELKLQDNRTKRMHIEKHMGSNISGYSLSVMLSRLAKIVVHDEQIIEKEKQNG